KRLAPGSGERTAAAGAALPKKGVRRWSRGSGRVAIVAALLLGGTMGLGSMYWYRPRHDDSNAAIPTPAPRNEPVRPDIVPVEIPLPASPSVAQPQAAPARVI